jgi:NifU-like protein involved in Fe-S cluster formation
MSQRSLKLYSPRLLALSARLSDYPLLNNLPITATARSRTCGSVIDVGLDTDAQGAISRIGMLVSACAVGQSAAAIMAEGMSGRDLAKLKRTLEQIEGWLDGQGDPPDWPQFDALLPAREHSGRHGALLLPWKAAVEALSSHAAGG